MSSFQGPNIKTVLGDNIYWDNLKLPLEGCANRDPGQILRCRKHKRLEAKFVLSLAIGSTILDVGSHFGDTIVTLAIHARENGRDDLRFIAFEPSKRKCKFIRSMVKANNLEKSVRIVNFAVGDACREVKQVDEQGFVRYDGRVAYVDAGEDSNVVEMRSSEPHTPFYYDARIHQGGEDSGSESDDDNDADDDDDSNFPMISLDSMKAEILPLGLLHLDVEGWEARALAGARSIISHTTDTAYVICEVWDEKDRKRRQKAVIGKASSKPGHDILDEMKLHDHFVRLDDIVDQERNFVFKCALEDS